MQGLSCNRRLSADVRQSAYEDHRWESHSYAFADEENDITLLEAASKSVCMMNGNPKLKAVSDYITFRDNNSDGLADFLELFS